MKGFVNDIEKLTKDNKDFRRVLYTARECRVLGYFLTARDVRS
jgi:hypothetical protein